MAFSNLKKKIGTQVKVRTAADRIVQVKAPTLVVAAFQSSI